MGQKKRKNNLVVKENACVFCGKDEDDEVLYGKFYHKGDISVHQNCMFFSSGLVQRGSRQSAGILGFLISDIKEEHSRGQKLKCVVCKKYGSTIGCNVNSCRKTYHFPCGVKSKVLFQHFGKFASYCQSHKPQQKSIKFHEDLYCHICCTHISKDEVEECLYSPCCKKNLFHYLCLQKYALSAGLHFFKCPLCNNSEEFIKEMHNFGICIPNKDAAWELDNNAYNDLLYRPGCSSEDCKCKKGREHDGENGWELMICADCGADAKHRTCGDIKESVTTWKCKDCETLETKIMSKKIPNKESETVVESSSTDLSSTQECSEIERQPCRNNTTDLFENISSEATNQENKIVVESSSMDFSSAELEPQPSGSKTIDIINIDSDIDISSSSENHSFNVDSDVKTLNNSEEQKENYLDMKALSVCLSDNGKNLSDQVSKALTVTEPIIIIDAKIGNLNVLNKSSKTDNVTIVGKKLSLVSPSTETKPQKRRFTDISNKGPNPRRFKKIQHGCCSDLSNRCIRKMFGLECHSFKS